MNNEKVADQHRGPSKAGCKPGRRAQLAALKAESDLALRDQIRRRLALPVEQRTNFLRVRLPLPGGGSCL
jgi:hypothetical protein